MALGLTFIIVGLVFVILFLLSGKLKGSSFFGEFGEIVHIRAKYTALIVGILFIIIGLVLSFF